MKMMSISGVLFVALALSLNGCDGDDHHDEEHEDSAAAHACGHLDGGDTVNVVAAEFASKAYPDVSAAHTLYDIALADQDGDGLLYLQYQAATVGDHTLFFTGEVPLKLTGPDGSEVVPEHSGGSPEDCPGFLAHHLVEFDIGTYTLELGPTDLSEVSLVVYVGSDEHEHEEEHD